jgi:hypothetical protein
MKVFSSNLHRLQAGSPVTPEVYNYNVSNLADSNNDIASKRYTRWSTVYQYGGYNNTFSTQVLNFKIPDSFGMTSGISLNQPTFDAVGVLTAGSYSDIKFASQGGKVVLLGLVGGVTTFVTYTLAVNNDISSVINTPVSFTVAAAAFTNVRGFCFNETGTKLFTITQAVPSVVKEHSLATAFDISTVNTTPTFSLASASNNLNYISFNIDLQSLNSGQDLYYGAKGATTLIRRFCVTRYLLSSAGGEVVLTPAPNDSLYGVHVAEDGGTTTRFRTALTLVDYAAGAAFIRSHTNRSSDSRDDVFLIASYRNLKTFNLITPNAFAVSRLGTDCLNMSTNGFITEYVLKTPFLQPPSVGIERIIIAGYYTSANPITLTVTGNGLSDTYTITLPASTDALERRFDFDGKKINIKPSVTSPGPTLAIASTGIFNISKLDVELHFISDRLADQLSSSIVIQPGDTDLTGIIELDSTDYITENELVLAAKVNTSKLEVAKLNRQNINCDGNFRWLHYSALNISSAAPHIFEIPPTRNFNNVSNNINTFTQGGNSNQVITGFYIAVSTITGAALNIADTISINSGANFKQTVNFTATNNQQIKFQPTISGVLPAPYFGSAEQITSGSPISPTTAEYNTRFFTITTTTALLLKVQVYLMYA